MCLSVLSAVIYLLLRDYSCFISIWILFYTKWWPFLLFYFFWIYIDRNTCENGGRPILRLFQKDSATLDYFPIRLHGTENCKLKPEKNYMLINQPHGLYIWGLSGIIKSLKYMRQHFQYHLFYLAFFTIQFHIPFSREIAFFKNMISSSANSINLMLRRPDGGNVVVITPDGLQGVLLTKKGLNQCYLKKRKGFVKLALKNGTPIIPSYTFGEVDLYDQWFQTPRMRKIQLWIKERTNLTLLIPRGRFGYFSASLIPFKIPLNIVFGEPIEVDKNENPTEEEIDRLHSLFLEKLVELFEKYKHRFIENAEKVYLEIV